MICRLLVFMLLFLTHSIALKSSSASKVFSFFHIPFIFQTIIFDFILIMIIFALGLCRFRFFFSRRTLYWITFILRFIPYIFVLSLSEQSSFSSYPIGEMWITPFALGNRFQSECFPKHYKPNQLKSRVNRYPAHMCSSAVALTQ